MNILTVTSLYPNREMPRHGIFVENRLRHLVASGGVDLRVVAPVPWFPVTAEWAGTYGRYARVPQEEVRQGISVTHPRYPLIPKLGMALAPAGFYHGISGHIRKLLGRGPAADLIDAHYFYPDGVAAVRLARSLGIPVTVTARGTDLNLIPRFARARRMIVTAAMQADALITVCQALKDVLVDELGVPASKVTVLRNGVDLHQFAPPHDREAARAELGLTTPALASVGHLIPRKGHDIAIRALAQLPGVTLLIAGEGPERQALESLGESLGVGDRLCFLGAVPYDRIAQVYGAVDALVLASDREGWPNVLLESMACGTPVVAAQCWGTPEVVTAPEAGRLVAPRTPTAFADAIRRQLTAPADRAATRAYAERFSWDATTAGQLDLFRSVLAGARRGVAPHPVRSSVSARP
ncbi:MAG: glycosyltransferase [Alphaproteobacteria bacterium]|jgi:glycosyltransferase involved in cell wall biosynthesis|nr:glycosyltransferase [Alphaproteobacteria bacterium]